MFTILLKSTINKSLFLFLFSATSGVPQGKVLGPLLLLHVNELPSVMEPGTLARLYADGALICRIINSIGDKDLIRLKSRAKFWGMVFNPSKCYMMQIGLGRNFQPHMYVLCGTILESVSSEHYLEVYVNHDFKLGEGGD